MKNILTASLLVLATSIASASVFAHQISCDIQLEAGVKVSKDNLEFLDDSENNLYTITDNKVLIVKGKTIALNAKQQSLVTQYSTSIRDVVPEVKAIALDALSLASDGLTKAFDELLGENNQVGTDITTELDTIHQQIETHFSAEQGFYLNDDGIDGGEIFGEDFEERIEAVIEKAVQNSMGTLLMALGKEMLTSGGDMDAFETRMEDFGEKIEHEMETHAKSFEKRGDELCASAVAIDVLESKLQANIPELSDIDVLTAKQGKSHNKNSI